MSSLLEDASTSSGTFIQARTPWRNSLKSSPLSQLFGTMATHSTVQIAGREDFFMSSFSDIDWSNVKNDEICFSSATEVTHYSAQFRPGHWCWWGPGGENFGTTAKAAHRMQVHGTPGAFLSQFEIELCSQLFVSVLCCVDVTERDKTLSPQKTPREVDSYGHQATLLTQKKIGALL